MRENLPQTQVNQDGEFLFKLLADNSRVLKGIHIMSEDAQIEWPKLYQFINHLTKHLSRTTGQ